MNSDENDKKPDRDYWKGIAIEVLGKTKAGQDLILRCQTEEDFQRSLKIIQDDLENQIWEQFRKKRESISLHEQKKRELAAVNKEMEEIVLKATSFEQKMIQNLNEIMPNRKSAESSEQSSTSMQEMEINGGNITLPVPKFKVENSGAVSTKANSHKTIKFLEERLSNCASKIEETRMQTSKLLKQELYLAAKIKTLTFKYQNLESLESLRISQLAHAKKEVEKAKLSVLRKKRNIQALTTMSHEVEVEPCLMLG